MANGWQFGQQDTSKCKLHHIQTKMQRTIPKNINVALKYTML